MNRQAIIDLIEGMQDDLATLLGEFVDPPDPADPADPDINPVTDQPWHTVDLLLANDPIPNFHDGRGIVTAARLNVRLDSTYTSPKVADLNMGSIVVVDEDRFTQGWIYVPGGDGWVAVRHLKPTPIVVSGRPPKMMGMNIDPRNPAGWVEPDQLGDCKLVRMVLNISDLGNRLNRDPEAKQAWDNWSEERRKAYTYGGDVIESAISMYGAMADGLTKHGCTIVWVITHQTYGEGLDLRIRPAGVIEMLAKVMPAIMGDSDPAQHWFQLYNEVSNETGAGITMPAPLYATTAQAIAVAIRDEWPSSKIIGAGLAAGGGADAIYMTEVIRRGFVPDMAASHIYGQTTREQPDLKVHGWIDDHMRELKRVNIDWMISEWGLIEKQMHTPANIAAAWAESMLHHIGNHWPIWFASAFIHNNVPGLWNEPLTSVLTKAQTTSQHFGSPVDPNAKKTIPPGWMSAISYNEPYTHPPIRVGTFHTGIDLNKTDDRDREAHVYAVADGVVTYAEKLEGSWGNVVIIEHFDTSYSRSAHLLSIEDGISRGSAVRRGQKIGEIGGAELGFNDHLHFDIAITDILRQEPWHWPGANRFVLEQHYVDPVPYIEDRMP